MSQSGAPGVAPAGGDEAVASAPPGLKGQMGVGQLVFMVLSFNAPIVVAFGYLSFVILFQGMTAPLAYVAVTVLLLLFSMGFARMSLQLPNPGAFYAFVTAGLGRTAGLAGAVTAVAGYFVLTLQTYTFLGVASSSFVADVCHGPSVGWYWYTLAFWVVVFVGGYVSVEFAVKAIMAGTVLGLLIIAGFDLAVMRGGGVEGLSWAPFVPRNAASGSVGLGLLFAMVTCLGFESTVIYREETRHPTRVIPMATYVSVAVIGGLYAVTTWCLVNAYGVKEAAAVAAKDPYGMFSKVLGSYLGQVAVDAGMFLAIVAALAATLSIHNAVTRYCYSLGVDGAFPRPLGRAHPRHHSPHVASSVVGFASLVFLLAFAVLPFNPVFLYARLAGGATMGLLVLYAMTAIAVVAYFSRQPVGSARWRTLIVPVVAAVGLAALLWLAMANFNLLMDCPWSVALPALLLVLAIPVGGCVLALYFRRHKPAIYERIGRNS